MKGVSFVKGSKCGESLHVLLVFVSSLVNVNIYWFSRVVTPNIPSRSLFSCSFVGNHHDVWVQQIRHSCESLYQLLLFSRTFTSFPVNICFYALSTHSKAFDT